MPKAASERIRSFFTETSIGCQEAFLRRALMRSATLVCSHEALPPPWPEFASIFLDEVVIGAGFWAKANVCSRSVWRGYADR
jgi:hypothetical protein